jgi:hypothetical protein
MGQKGECLIPNISQWLYAANQNPQNWHYWGFE